MSNFKAINNDQKLISVSFILRLRLKNMVLALEFTKFGFKLQVFDNCDIFRTWKKI